MFAKLNPTGPSQSAHSAWLVVGVALMSLSALPFTSQIQSQALASEFATSGCEDLEDSLRRHGSGECSLEYSGEDGVKVTGNVTAKITKQEMYDHITEEKKSGKVIELQLTTEAGVRSEGIETEAEEAKPMIVGLDDLDKLSDKIQKMFDKRANRQVDKLAELREQKRKVDLCLIDRRGNDIRADQQMSCRVSRWSTMSGEKAARYFNDNLQPQVQEMLGSSDQVTANQGKELLRQINQSGAADVYVRRAINDLNRYGQETDKVRAAQQIIDNNPDASDAQKAQWHKALKASQASAARSFKAQANRLGNSGIGSIGSFDAMADLKSDLKSYQDQLDASYEGILATLAASTSAPVDGTDASVSPTPTDGVQQSSRPVRILPNNPWPAGVGGQKPTLPSTKPAFGTPVGG